MSSWTQGTGLVSPFLGWNHWWLKIICLLETDDQSLECVLEMLRSEQTKWIRRRREVRQTNELSWRFHNATGLPEDFHQKIPVAADDDDDAYPRWFIKVFPRKTDRKSRYHCEVTSLAGGGRRREEGKNSTALTHTPLSSSLSYLSHWGCLGKTSSGWQLKTRGRCWMDRLKYKRRKKVSNVLSKYKYVSRNTDVRNKDEE